jgi:hypothetical protein
MPNTVFSKDFLLNLTKKVFICAYLRIASIQQIYEIGLLRQRVYYLFILSK